MIVEDERDDIIYDGDWEFQGEFEPQAGVASWDYFLHMYNLFRD
jgi:hypothetical protein